jgi:hypothetical protein
MLTRDFEDFDLFDQLTVKFHIRIDVSAFCHFYYTKNEYWDECHSTQRKKDFICIFSSAKAPQAVGLLAMTDTKL